MYFYPEFYESDLVIIAGEFEQDPFVVKNVFEEITDFIGWMSKPHNITAK
jgi:hypothetical protein